MVAEERLAFRIPGNEGADSVLESLGKSFSLSAGRSVSRRLVFFDTFDWRLFWAGATLRVESDGQLRLSRSGGDLIESLPKGKRFAFSRDFSESPMGSALGPLIKMRRLLPLVEIHERSREIRVLDREQKTVVRMIQQQGTVRDPAGDSSCFDLPVLLRLEPVRGYSRELGRIAEHMGTTQGLPLESSSTLSLALSVLGRQPGDYSSKLRLEIAPSAPTHEAVREILRALLAIMRCNEDGVRRNLDSEFLHDFRVAVRRTRSALGQIKDVFPGEAVERFRKDFAWLGLRTGPCRDLDVLDLKIDEYARDLAPAHKEDLCALGRFLSQRRRVERRRLLAALGSKRYLSLKASWQSFLDDFFPEDGDDVPNALRPIEPVASERIWRLWKRIRKRGLSISTESPAQELHALRIECKKLRYLMEFFRSLYHPREMDELIGSLKKLQDALGDFNDFAVHQEQLQALGVEMGREDDVEASTLLALGRLLEHLEWQSREQKREATRRIRPFLTQENRGRFRLLFRVSEEVAP